jgi:Flp pilus assembly protein TadG
MNASRSHRSTERGQVIAIFALALVAIIAMTGLVLDGGSSTVQKRDEQNVADAAALAAAYNYVNTKSTGAATAAAQTVASANGYTHGVNGAVVSISITTGNPSTFIVTVTKPHRNYFSGVVGLSSWDVTATATAIGGQPNVAYGVMPIMFNDDVLDPVTGNGYGPSNVFSYGEPGSGTEDVPQGNLQFNWTVFCPDAGCSGTNADSNTVDGYINNEGNGQKVALSDGLAPLNAGAHTTLFSDMANWIGEEFPVPIVDDAGVMVGWAMFHLTGSVGGSTKELSGYFVSPINPANLGYDDGGGVPLVVTGTYKVQLKN